MSLYERIHGKERREVDITPIRERRRGTPKWVARKIEREFRGEDGLPIQDRTFDMLEAA